MASPRDPRDPDDRSPPRSPPAVSRPTPAAFAPDDFGPLPDEENDFADTPTTAVSDMQPLDAEGPAPDPEAAEEVNLEADWGLAETPASGVYEDVRTAEPADPFTSEPPPEEPPTSLSEPLPEMAPDIWLAGVRALINV